MTSEIQEKICILDLVENGDLVSAVDREGTIYGTASGNRALLREVGFAAQAKGFELVMIGSQSWRVDRLTQMN